MDLSVEGFSAAVSETMRIAGLRVLLPAMAGGGEGGGGSGRELAVDKPLDIISANGTLRFPPSAFLQLPTGSTLIFGL